MNKFKLIALFTFLSLFVFSCEKDTVTSVHGSFDSTLLATARIYNGFPETFESGSKGSYAAADVALTTGSWNFSDALLGTTASDHKNGLKAARIQNSGMLTMNFNVPDGAKQVTVAFAKYGTDANSTFELYSSSNSGSTWTKEGNTVTASSTTVATATFSMARTGNIRFQLRKTSGGRLNLDDFSIDDNTGPTRDDNMAMGNPSSATTNTSVPNNYLMVKTQYALAYNNSRGTPAWVSWHLSPAWKGSQPRCDCFVSDATLPTGFYKAVTSNYTNTGFDRGHQCPSEDRDSTSADNAATFLMTNMMPQAPNLNRITWVALETYCRTLMDAGNELYIIAGGYGTGGTGTNGGVTTTFASGKITVPSHYWKVIVVLPQGSNDVTRVASSTRVIAVDMPNNQTVNANAWGTYRVSVDAIEAATGFNFLSNVSTTIQSSVEATTDTGPTN